MNKELCGKLGPCAAVPAVTVIMPCNEKGLSVDLEVTELLCKGQTVKTLV